jgi:hypothetical protein
MDVRRERVRKIVRQKEIENKKVLGAVGMKEERKVKRNSNKT